MSETADALERFTYTLVRPGWARVGLHPRSRRGFLGPRFNVSSRSDALGDLARTVIALLRGAERGQVTWHGDQGWGHTLLLQRDGERLRIEVGSFYPPYRHKTTELPGHPPTIFETTLSQFAKRVHHLLRVLFQQWGIDGYREMWPPYEFPLQEYSTLGDLIDERPGQPAKQIAES